MIALAVLLLLRLAAAGIEIQRDGWCETFEFVFRATNVTEAGKDTLFASFIP